MTDWCQLRNGATTDVQKDLLVLLQREMNHMASQEAITQEHIQLASVMCETCQVATTSDLKNLGQSLDENLLKWSEQNKTSCS